MNAPGEGKERRTKLKQTKVKLDGPTPNAPQKYPLKTRGRQNEKLEAYCLILGGRLYFFWFQF